MSRFRRRGFYITQMLAMLPLIAAVFTLALTLTTKSMRWQAREQRLMSDEATMRDLVRRIRSDVRTADKAAVESRETGAELQLVSKRGIITYSASGQRVVRTAQTDNTAETRYVWTLELARVGFAIEHMDAAPGLVWTTFTTISPVDHGPRLERRLAAAATIGCGGAS
ncbi:MAG: hypothetical protein JXO22_13915 [Phycisphaerae bacterium]|nr:hypothetical protein [Phycisphaerae bacterium]